MENIFSFINFWDSEERIKWLFCLGMSECDEICYKDPVLKDRQWSAYIDRSPGAVGYSEVLHYIFVWELLVLNIYFP